MLTGHEGRYLGVDWTDRVAADDGFLDTYSPLPGHGRGRCNHAFIHMHGRSC